MVPHVAFTHNKFMYINREEREHRVFKLLLQMVPGIEGRLTESSDEDVAHIAELVGFFTPSSNADTHTQITVVD